MGAYPPPSPYPCWGGYMMHPQMQPQPPPQQGAQLGGGGNPLLRQLLGTAIAGPRVGAFNPPARSAEAAAAAGADDASAATAAAESTATLGGTMPHSMPPMAASYGMMHPQAAGYGMMHPQAFGMPYMQQGAPTGMLGAAHGVGPAVGGASPAALAALGMVDESFRDQIDLLRKAAARHRSLLERAQAPAPIISTSVPVIAAVDTASDG